MASLQRRKSSSMAAMGALPRKPRRILVRGNSSLNASETKSEVRSQDPSRRRRRACRVVVDISACCYAIIRKCLREREFRLVGKANRERERPVPWDIWWSDRGDLLKDLPRLNAFQKVNHFPSMEEICRKDFLANNLNAMAKVMPDDFDFFPRSYLLPADRVELEIEMDKAPKNTTYIVKPRTLCQGKGITLIQSKGKLPNGPCVVQRYISNPLLIDGFKFDLRIYVLVLSVLPLQLHIFRNGLGRFCTSAFVKPTRKNLNQKRMHLTNYAINKSSKNFQQATTQSSEASASKRSLDTVMKHIEETMGAGASDQIWQQIRAIVVKTLLSTQPKLQASYKSFFGTNSNSASADGQSSSKCFEILGFDVLLDSTGRAWLLEVNHAPSFAGDSPLDREIKGALIHSTLKLVGVTNEQKRLFVRQRKQEWNQRLWQVQKPAKVKANEVTSVSQATEAEKHDNQTSSSGLKRPSSLEPEQVDDEETRSQESDSSSSNQSESSASNNEDGTEERETNNELGPSLELAFQRFSIKNVFRKANRVTPVVPTVLTRTCEKSPQRITAFSNEFEQIYPIEISGENDMRAIQLQTQYEKILAAAEVNRSKLWN